MQLDLKLDDLVQKFRFLVLLSCILLFLFFVFFLYVFFLYKVSKICDFQNIYEKKIENKDNEVWFDEVGDLDFYVKLFGFGFNYVNGLYVFV